MSSAQRLATAVLMISASFAGGCDKKSPDELPEWSPADHDNQSNPQPGQVDTKAPRPGMPSLEKYGITDVVLATWKQSCVPCHGVIGRGDGPQGAALRPRDLTDPKWQRVAIDSEIAHTIQKGRGRMPGFPQLPEDTVNGLVRLVRMLNADPNQKPGASEGEPEKTGDDPAKSPSAPSGPAQSDD